MGSNKTPSVPGLSGEERALLQKQGTSLDQFNSILQGATGDATNTQNILQSLSGLYNPDGSINQQALASLQQRVQQQQTIDQGLSGQANQALGGIFDQGQLGTLSDQAGVQEAQNYLTALSGPGSVSEAQKQAEAEQFRKLTEAAGQRGIRITGNDLFTATSDSTSGNQLLSQLRKEAQLGRETYRNNELNRLQQANMQRLGFGLNRQGQTYDIAQGLRQDPAAQQLGYATNATTMGPASLLGSYQGLSQSYGAAAQPYQQQRYLQYQGQLQNAANRTARNQAIGSLLGGATGAAIGSTVPGGTGLGFGLGSGAGGAIGGLF